MNRNTLRWILTGLMILALVFTLSWPYVSEAELVVEEISGVLPLDYLQGGKPPKAEGWTFEGKQPVSYEDSTIKVTFEREEISHQLISGKHSGKR